VEMSNDGNIGILTRSAYGLLISDDYSLLSTLEWTTWVDGSSLYGNGLVPINLKCLSSISLFNAYVNKLWGA
jgi:hypothetical protein